MLVNATAAWVLSTVLCWDDTVTTQQSWLVCGVIFFLLQMVAHASYRTNETSWLAGAAICAMVLVAHAQALVKLDDLTLLVAVLAGVLGVLTVMHNRKTSVFVRYDPHETRAMVVSLVAFLIAVRLAAVEASGASQYSNGLLYLAVGHAMASALSAFIFLVGALWLPEDASAWRLTAIDCVLLVPFIVVPLSLVVYNGGVLQYAFGIAASWGVADNFVVEYVKSQSPQQLLFLTIAISVRYVTQRSSVAAVVCIATVSPPRAVLLLPQRAMSDLCVRALSSHSMTFLPLVALTYDRGSARSNLLGLTFNGGPDPESTPALLQALAEYEAKATFFITLERALAYPKLVRDIHDDGHQIGVLGTARVDVFGIAAVTEARKACRVITYITGVSPTLYRPPVSGGRSPLALQAIANMGMTITMWSLCPWEWQGTEAEVYSRCVSSWCVSPPPPPLSLSPPFRVAAVPHDCLLFPCSTVCPRLWTPPDTLCCSTRLSPRPSLASWCPRRT